MASALAKLRKHLGFSGKTSASSLPGELCRRFSLGEIKTATHNFNEELVVGWSGFDRPVYKVFIKGNSRPVAIKRLSLSSGQGEEEFRKETLLLCQIRHVNLITLIGYCNDESQMIVVYDFMANNNLHHHLHGTDKAPLLWKQRLQICIGAARGLHYLHTGLRHPVIHCDVKPSNILLDDKWVAKVSDFGFSTQVLKYRNRNLVVDKEVTCGPLDQEHIEATRIFGTYGYVAPEYVTHLHLSEKTDVYSFGVVLLEVLCAREAVEFKLEKEQRVLTLWARECIKKGSIYRIIDPYLKGKIAPECFKVYVEIAMTCLQDPAIHRPTMVDVVDKLELALELQEKADAESFEINEGGFQFLDEEEKAFLNSRNFEFNELGGFQRSDEEVYTQQF